MKTITAKEFQLKHAAIVKQVANGDEYEVLFHRKPYIRLVPLVKKQNTFPKQGSLEAVIHSLNYIFQKKELFNDKSYKELKAQLLEDKYDK